MKKVLSFHDFQKNQVINLVLEKLAAPNPAPVEALIYFNTLTKTIRYHNGTVWKEITDGHVQNTDAGTTEQSFQVDTGNNGPRIKNNSGVLELRNAADNGYSDLRIKNLIIEGELLETIANIVNVGDQEMLLNADITLRSQNANGWFSVKRLDIDNLTRRDAKFFWDEISGRWKVILGDYVSEVVVSLKFSQIIGDGVAQQFDIIHNLNSIDSVVSVRRNVSPYNDVVCEIERLSVDAVRVKFAGYIPLNSEFKVTVQG